VLPHFHETFVEALVVTDPSIQSDFEVMDLPYESVAALLTLLFGEEPSTSRAVAA
jgi:hypothetical protein